MRSDSPNCKARPCTCKHDFQDERYGKGMRIHNRMKQVAAGKDAASGGGKWRCTICSKES